MLPTLASYSGQYLATCVSGFLLNHVKQTLNFIHVPASGENLYADFHRDYEFMGAQRHLKVLGIFARLYHRDGKDGYLKDLPRVMKYLLQTALRYRDLAPLARLLQRLEGITPQTGYTF